MKNPHNQTQGPAVLVIDDNLDILNLLQLYLSAKGYRVEISVNGYDALNKLSKSPYDLILTDICMPGLNGNELVRLVRGGRYNDLQIIAITANPLLATEDFNQVVAKPFVIEDLENLLHDLLNKHSARVYAIKKSREP